MTRLLQYHSAGTKTVVACLMLFLFYFGIRTPLIFNRRFPNDYDLPVMAINVARTHHVYGINRVPGAPLFDMSQILLYHKLLAPWCHLTETQDGIRFGRIIENDNKRVFTDSAFLIYCKILSGLAGFWVLWLFYREETIVLSPAVSVLVAMTFAVQPVFMWMSTAWSEDIMSLALGYTALVASRRRWNWWSSAFLASLAAGCKLTAGAFVIGASLNYALREPTFKKRLLVLMRYGAVVGLLTAIFYMPVYIHYNLDLGTLRIQLQQPMIGISLPQCIKTGLLLFRNFFPIWILMAVYLAWTYARRWRQEEVQPVNPWDGMIAAILLCLLADFHKAAPAAALMAAAGALTVLCLWRYYSPTFRIAREDWGDMMVLGITGLFVLQSPYSSSYFLFLIPSGLYFLSKRFRTKSFWALAVIISLVPMFHFVSYDFGKPEILIYGDGLYGVLLSDAPRWNDINDFGYKWRKPMITLGR